MGTGPKSERRREMNFKLITFLLLLLVLCSCERRDITYYMESEISVTADWSRAGLEEEKEDGATLVIFPQDGSQPRVIYHCAPTPWHLRRCAFQSYFHRFQ